MRDYKILRREVDRRIKNDQANVVFCEKNKSRGSLKRVSLRILANNEDVFMNLEFCLPYDLQRSDKIVF